MRFEVSKSSRALSTLFYTKNIMLGRGLDLMICSITWHLDPGSLFIGVRHFVPVSKNSLVKYTTLIDIYTGQL